MLPFSVNCNNDLKICLLLYLSTKFVSFSVVIIVLIYQSTVLWMLYIYIRPDLCKWWNLRYLSLFGLRNIDLSDVNLLNFNRLYLQSLMHQQMASLIQKTGIFLCIFIELKLNFLILKFTLTLCFRTANSIRKWKFLCLRTNKKIWCR